MPRSDTGLARDGKAQAEQLRSISFERIVRTIGHVSPERLGELGETLRLQHAL